MTDEALPTRRSRRREAGRPGPRRRGTSIVAVLGEILITLGVVVLLFIAWQQWFNDLVVSGNTRADASNLQQQLNAAVPTETPKPSADGSQAPAPVTPAAKDGDKFGVLYIPRFGATYKVPIAQGTSTTGELDFGYAGHYDSSQMPGAAGNFAIAGHRTTHGAPFNKIADLRVGDHIYVQTAKGWYTYTFRNLQYVKPTQVSVLQQVPDAPKVDTTSKDHLITLTSCNPLYSATERIIAFGVLTSWQPGPPSDLPASATDGKA